MNELSNLAHYIPRHLDDRQKFLFWEIDVAIIALIIASIGIYISFPISGIAAGIAIAYLYSKLKTGQHPGMATHLLYWFVGFPNLKECPNSYLREFNG